MPNPIAPDCKMQCPQTLTDEEGKYVAYCSDCDAYLEQSVTEQNTARILAEMPKE